MKKLIYILLLLPTLLFGQTLELEKGTYYVQYNELNEFINFITTFIEYLYTIFLIMKKIRKNFMIEHGKITSRLKVLLKI